MTAPARDRARSIHERQFYALNRAVGRFGIRSFRPQIMAAPHWHGHVEFNYLENASMTYDVDGRVVELPPGRLALFWAGVPHQLTAVTPLGEAPPRLTNLYLPLDAFLFMPHVAALQITLLNGGLALMPEAVCDAATLDRWYRDYRSNDVERVEILKMELNAILRRGLLGGIDWLLGDPGAESGRTQAPAHAHHVVAMIRFIVENLAEPMSNADIAAATGLHENYATTLFSRAMRLPPKQFLIRMRLLRARALLMESGTPVTAIAAASGFSSSSQFYTHFRAAYGMPPQVMRDRYMAMTLR